MKVLITAGSKHGSTAEIGDAIATVMRKHGLEVTIRPPSAFTSITGYDAFVIGSAVYAGRWREEVKEFVDRHALELRDHDVWLFSSGPLGDPLKPEDDPIDAVAMMEKTGAREHRVFAGNLDKGKLGLGERAVVRAVRASYGDFRNWDAIISWGTEIAGCLAVPSGR